MPTLVIGNNFAGAGAVASPMGSGTDIHALPVAPAVVASLNGVW